MFWAPTRTNGFGKFGRGRAPLLRRRDSVFDRIRLSVPYQTRLRTANGRIERYPEPNVMWRIGGGRHAALSGEATPCEDSEIHGGVIRDALNLSAAEVDTESRHSAIGSGSSWPPCASWIEPNAATGLFRDDGKYRRRRKNKWADPWISRMWKTNLTYSRMGSQNRRKWYIELLGDFGKKSPAPATYRAG